MSTHLATAARSHVAGITGQASPSLPSVHGATGLVVVRAGQVFADLGNGIIRGPLRRGSIALPPAGAVCLVSETINNGQSVAWLVAVDGWVAS